MIIPEQRATGAIGPSSAPARRIARAAALILSVAATGCPRGGGHPPGEQRAPQAVVDREKFRGWILDIAETPDTARQIVESSEGWPVFLGGRYNDAVKAFSVAGAAGPGASRVGLARAHLELARVRRSLALLLAAGQLQLLKRRADGGLDAAELPHAGYFQGVDLLLLGQRAPGLAALKGYAANARADLKPAAEAWLAGCGAGKAKTPPALAYLAAVSCRLDHGALDPCAAPPAAPAAGAPRNEQYGGIACDHGRDLDDAAWLALASEPAARDPLHDRIKNAGQGDTVDFTFHDPTALWALAEHDLRRGLDLLDGSAEQEPIRQAACSELGLEACPKAQAGGTVSALAVAIFSHGSPSDLGAIRPNLVGTASAAGAEVIKVRRQYEATRAAWKEALTQLGTEPGRQAVTGLGVGEMAADLELRREAVRLQSAGDCAGALQLLQLSRDPASPDHLSFRNDPSFFLELAGAALCAHRHSEAIGALAALAGQYPEAEPVLKLARRIATTEVQGGVDVARRN